LDKRQIQGFACSNPDLLQDLMLTHIVCFKFADPAHAEEACRRLLSMKGQIPSLLGLEAGLDVTRGNLSYDVGLVTRHEDVAGLQAYVVHPVHEAVAAYIRSVCTARVAVDFQG
jgi:hypothetical protein